MLALSEITGGITPSQKAIRQRQGQTNTLWVMAPYKMAAPSHNTAAEQNGALCVQWEGTCCGWPLGEQFERGLVPLGEQGGAACPTVRGHCGNKRNVKSEKTDTDTWAEGHGIKTTGIGRDFFIGDHISEPAGSGLPGDTVGKQVHFSLLLGQSICCLFKTIHSYF